MGNCYQLEEWNQKKSQLLVSNILCITLSIPIINPTIYWKLSENSGNQYFFINEIEILLMFREFFVVELYSYAALNSYFFICFCI